jgi:hypothetical protein
VSLLLLANDGWDGRVSPRVPSAPDVSLWVLPGAHANAVDDRRLHGRLTALLEPVVLRMLL